MTAQSAIPLKWYVPFAQSDSARVEVPVTSSDPTRASQTLGFPPLTMQPPAVGGVPPQGEDFNGAMNQVARIAWWVLNGGGWPYDATFATNTNIGGYPNGAVLQSADFLGQWISTADNNQSNPDTVGTGWVPGFQYGSTALTGQTGGTTTLTPLQAAKRSITVAGSLTSALTLVLPAWVKDWSITNNTTGAFTVTAKTASGSGVTIPQNGSPTPVAGDGTNINQSAQNVAQGTSPTHAMTVAQAAGVIGSMRNLVCDIPVASNTAAITADEIVVETALGGTRYCLSNFSKSINISTVGVGGMDVAGLPATAIVAIYAIYNPSTGASGLLGWNATTVAPSIYPGSAMPAGYVASALLTVLLVTSSQFIVSYVQDRHVTINQINQLATSTSSASNALLLMGLPLNAKTCDLNVTLVSTTATNANVAVGATSAGTLGTSSFQVAGGSGSGAMYLRKFALRTAQTIWYSISNSAGTPSTVFALVGYDI